MTDDESLKRWSKTLSYLLRHRPDKAGLKMDKEGWVDVFDLLAALDKQGNYMNLTNLHEAVNTNDKKRFEFNDDMTKIRAHQGHSVDVDIGYKDQEPPEFLYHGTAIRFVDPIQKDGLQKMKRHAVHLSKDVDTDSKVGRRHGKLAIFRVRTGDMHKAGYKFQLTNNEVWLIDHVPPEYLDLM